MLTIGALLVLAAVVASRWESWLMNALAPSGLFDARAAPPAPDYAHAAAWTALPERQDAADAVPQGTRAIEQMTAAVAVFYVHPTTYLGASWNGPVDDPELNGQTDELATLIQASTFNGCCAVYGPRYRQANGDAFVRTSADGDAAIDLAYGDVVEAFRFFLAHHARGRPFLLASHSQGSVLAARLLRQEIAGTPLAPRLVAAYLIGGPIDTEPPPGVPICAAADETGCLVAWNARGPRFAGSAFEFHQAGERVCVNPLSWHHDEEPAGADQNLGAVFLESDDPAVWPAFADARCKDGMLIVSEIGDPPRDFMSTVLDFVLGPENYHPIEYQLYSMNLRRNAEQRVDAYVREQSAAP